MERLVGGDGIVRVLAIPQGNQFRLAVADVLRIHPFAPETVVDLLVEIRVDVHPNVSGTVVLTDGFKVHAVWLVQDAA